MDLNQLPHGKSQDILIEPRKRLAKSTLEEVLRNCGLKITNQRLSILEALNSGPRVHMTAQDILDEVRKKQPFIGFATVYRLLKTLHANGVISEVSMGSGSSRYELKSKNFHYHISCVECKKIIEFKSKEIEQAIKTIIKKKGFHIVHQILELYVKCNSPQCKSTH